MTILGYLWPKRTRCPECGCQRSRWSGTAGRIQYRLCLHCHSRYKVLAIARHTDRGGDQSEIEPL